MHSTARSSPPSTIGGSAGCVGASAHGPAPWRGSRRSSALRITGWTPSGANATQIPIRRYGIPLATPGFVRRAHARRLAVHVWTIDDAPEIGRLLDLGADGIMTDRPSVLKDVLQGRDLWF